MSIFAKNIRFLREKKGLTQAGMPDALGFSQSAWNNYEKEVSMPRFNDLIKISNFFGVNIDDLVTKDLAGGSTSLVKEPEKQYKTKDSQKRIQPEIPAGSGAQGIIEQLQQEYESTTTERDNLKKQLEFCQLTLKSLTDHIETLKDAMKLQMTRIEELQLAAKKRK